MKVKLDDGAFLPERAHESDAGYDLRTPIDAFVGATKTDHFFKQTRIGSATIDTGIHVEIPKGYVGFLKAKSGLNVNHGIIGEGVIDAGYTGSIKVKLYNLSDRGYEFKRGDKIIQLVILPILTPELEQVDSLKETDRGSNGFGSSGK